MPKDEIVVAGRNGSELAHGERKLTAAEFHQLAEVPPEAEWFAQIENPNTRRAYQRDVGEFMSFVGIQDVLEFRIVRRSHLLAWDRTLKERGLADSTRRRKLSALSSLFQYLTNANALEFNPVTGMIRPKGKSERTMCLGNDQAKLLLNAPESETLKGLRDRAIVSTYLFHGLRVAELCALRVCDWQVEDRGVPHLQVRGKGNKLRYVVAHSDSREKIAAYLEAVGHGDDKEGLLFRSVRGPKGGNQALSQQAVYEMIRSYALAAGIALEDCNHALRKTAATNALEHMADIARVRDWMGHEDISTTQVYDGRDSRPEDSPTNKVSY